MTQTTDTDYAFSGDVFRLSWLEDSEQLDSGLGGLRRIASSLLDEKGESEEDAQAIFLDPF